MYNKRGQIWIETVIYILIALVMIGAVLAFVNPKIKEIQDKLTIDKTIEMLEEFDSKISEVSSSVGNQRVINIEIKKGTLEIISNALSYELKETSVEYSQAGAGFVQTGKVKVQTEENNDRYNIKLSLPVDGITLDYDGGSLTQSSTAYKLALKNVGSNKIKITLIN